MGQHRVSQLSLRAAAGRLRAKIGSALLALIALAFLVIFFYGSLIHLMAKGLTGPEGLSLEKISSLFSSPYIWRLLTFTIGQAFLSMIVSAAVGLLMAYVLANFEFPGRKVVLTLTILPFAMPPVIVALGFVLIYGRSGPINQVLMSLFQLKEPPLQLLFSLSGVVLAHAFYNAPIVARFVAAAWSRLPMQHRESAQALGASRWSLFFDITLPMLLPSLISGATLAFIFSFLSFPVILAVGGAQFSTIEVEIYRRALIQIDQSGALALAAVALVCSLLLTWFYLKAERYHSRRLRAGIERARPPLFKGATWSQRVFHALIGSLFLIVAFFFIAPIAGVVVDSFARLSNGGVVLTLDSYREVLSPKYSSLIATSPLGSIANSLLYALMAMAVSMVFGVALALILSRTRFRGRVALEALAMAPLAISPITFGLALLYATFSAPPDFFASGFGIVIAHSVLATPFVIRALRPAFAQFDLRLYEAARSLGATPLHGLLDIVLPLLVGSLISAASFAFAISLAETSATMMLAQPETTTMPLSVYYLLSSRQWGGASAMAVLMLVVLGIALLMLNRFGRKILIGGSR